MKTIVIKIKTLWSRIPAWVKAIVLSILAFLTIVQLIQKILMYNLTANSEWGWGLLAIIPILVFFWFFVQKTTSFQGEEDVKISFKTDLSNKTVWLRFIGLFLMTGTCISTFAILLDSPAEEMTALFELFKPYGEGKALPILFGFALTAGIVEEVMCRGVLQNILVSAYPKALAFIGIGLLFAFFHSIPLALILPYALVSISFSLVADEFKSLGVNIMVHVLIDVFFLFAFYYSAFQGVLENLYVLLPAFLASIFCLLFKNQSITDYFRNRKLVFIN